MRPRFLLNLAPTDGGGVIPVSATPPAVTPPPAQTPAPATINLPAEEVNRLYDAARRLTDSEASRLRDIEAKEQERLLVLAQKGDVDRAFEEFKGTAATKYAGLEQKYVDRERSLVILEAMTGRDFTGDEARSQVKELLGLRVESVLGADGSVIVRDKVTGRPASDVLRELLASPSYAHFLKPTTQGGAGAGGNTPAPSSATGPIPGSLESIAAQFKQSQGQYPSFGLSAAPRG